MSMCCFRCEGGRKGGGVSAMGLLSVLLFLFVCALS